MKKTKFIITRSILFLGTMALLLSFVNTSNARVQAQSFQVVNQHTGILKLQVKGMHCQRFCANGTDTLLKHTPGVLFSKTTFATGTSIVRYDPALITPKKIIAVIDKRGFKTSITKDQKN